MSAVVIPVNLGQEFLLGTDVPNKITIKVDSATVQRAADGTISAPSGALTYDGVTTILTYDNGAGGVQNIDLSALTSDIFITGGAFDAASSVLTLTDADAGTPDVTIDLSTLLGASTDADSVLSDGADGKPKITAAEIQAIVDSNTLVITDAFAVPIHRAFPL